MTTPDATPPEPASVRIDPSQRRIWMLVSVAIATGGITLVVQGLQRDWGFMPVFWSGVLAFIGVGWIVGLLKGGGPAVAGCPHCSATITFTNIESARTEQCESCGEWSAGTKVMRPLAPEHVAERAVFRVPLPEHELRWPAGVDGTPRCPVCAEPCTRSVKVTASNVLGSALAALSPISLQRVHTLQVPSCPQHDDGVWLDMGDDDQGLMLLFRSWGYFNEFVELNKPAPPAEKPTPQTLAAFLEHNPRPIEVRAPLTCPKHEIPVLTAMGWVSSMDYLPSHEWLDDTVHNPVCLNIGQALDRPSKGKHLHERLAWCPECEVGMARLHKTRWG